MSPAPNSRRSTTPATATTSTRRPTSASASASPEPSSRAGHRAAVRRLACYGWVQEQAGSVASANYVVLRELARRGVEVDFYANREHMPRPEGIEGSFRYVGFDPPALPGALPLGAQRIANWILSPAVRAAWRRVYAPTAAARHRARPYDALLSLGTPPVFTIPGVPTVTWLQGPSQTELEAIRRLRSQIVRTSGRVFYLELVTYYRSRRLLDRRVLDPATHIVCGSEWSRRALVREGLRPERLYALPYPVDLEDFRLGEPRPDLDAPVILTLGRLDPRKRLDLLLEAFTRIRQALPAARLRIVGRAGYAPGQLSLLDECPLRTAVDYVPAVPREEVPALLREAAVLVQPSENENFGSAVAEALACGTPVVLGPSNGTADYVGECSGLFDRYTPDSVAASVIQVLEARRRKPVETQRRAREAAEQSFAAGRIVDRLTDIIQVAVGESGSATRLIPA